MKNELLTLQKEGKISAKTLERVNVAKSYIEKKYSMKKLVEEEKKNSKISLKSKIIKIGNLSTNI